MRRGLGIAGIQKKAQAQASYVEAGQALASEQLEQFKEMYEKFKVGLESFAKKHQKEISKNPLLRVHFQKMCSSIGVDPLASSKGFWAEMLGIGDFYYELGVKIVEVCLKLREQTGGLVDLKTLKSRLGQKVEDEDIIRAIDSLKPLGSGFAIIKVGNRKLVQSVPREMSSDTSALLELADASGHFNADDAVNKLIWAPERVKNALNLLIKEGLVWIDDQVKPREYWVPGLFAGI